MTQPTTLKKTSTQPITQPTSIVFSPQATADNKITISVSGLNLLKNLCAKNSILLLGGDI
jgi:hypothetical protein